MPRVHEKTKNKAGEPYSCVLCPSKIEPGQKYYEWKFRYGGIKRQHANHGRPKPSQLTQSKMSGVYSAIENCEGDISANDNPSDIAQALRDCASEIENVKDEYQSGLDNMPDGLREAAESGETGERISALDDFISSLTSTADDLEGEDKPEDQTEDEWLDDLRQRATDALGELSC